MAITPPALGSGTTTIRAMGPRDGRFASTLHRSALPHGFFPMLGRRFLQRYLSSFVCSEHAVALVAERDGESVGYLVGVLDEPRHYRHVVRHHGPMLTASGLVALSVRPCLAWWFIRSRALRYLVGLRRLSRVQVPSSGRVIDGRSAAVLTHLAVAADARGSGVGGELVAAFEAAVVAAGLTSARLLTRAGDAGAGRFYESRRWVPSELTMDRDGVAWSRYRIELR